MEQWVPFKKGDYLAERAFLVAADMCAVSIENVLITVYTGSGGKRGIKGNGMIRPALMVELLEDNDDVDLILDLGGEFKYCLQAPDLFAGKVFSPDVTSLMQFAPTKPWKQLSESEFNDLQSRLRYI